MFKTYIISRSQKQSFRGTGPGGRGHTSNVFPFYLLPSAFCLSSVTLAYWRSPIPIGEVRLIENPWTSIIVSMPSTNGEVAA